MIDALFSELELHINEIRGKFLNHYIPADPSHRPLDYQHDVKAACVLAHAAFEEFVESVSMEIMRVATDRWLNQRTSCDALLALCITHRVAITAEEDEGKEQKRCFDLLRSAIDDAKKNHSKLINDNHGFSMKYLRATLTPVAINAPNDEFLIDSLSKLTSARGSFAHKAAKGATYGIGNRARNQIQMAPEDTAKVIEDCLLVCSQIKDGAKLATPQPEKPSRISFKTKLKIRQDIPQKISNTLLGPLTTHKKRSGKRT